MNSHTQLWVLWCNKVQVNWIVHVQWSLCLWPLCAASFCSQLFENQLQAQFKTLLWQSICLFFFFSLTICQDIDTRSLYQRSVWPNTAMDEGVVQRAGGGLACRTSPSTWSASSWAGSRWACWASCSGSPPRPGSPAAAAPGRWTTRRARKWPGEVGRGGEGASTVLKARRRRSWEGRRRLGDGEVTCSGSTWQNMEIFSLTEFSSAVEQRHMICWRRQGKEKRSLPSNTWQSQKFEGQRVSYLGWMLAQSIPNQQRRRWTRSRFVLTGHSSSLASSGKGEVTYQIRWQAESSQLSDTVLGRLGLLLSSCTRLDRKTQSCECAEQAVRCTILEELANGVSADSVVSLMESDRQGSLSCPGAWKRS